MFTVWRWKNLS